MRAIMWTRLRRAAQLGAAIGFPFVFAGAGPASAIPNFSSATFGWIALSPNYQLPAGGPHHVTQHPDYPWKAAGRGEAPVWRMADLDNPILQPWAREELRKNNERILAGGTAYTRQVSCWPMGTPAFLLYPVQPIYFIQTPDKVTLIAQLDHQVRHIYMNVPHSKTVKPSWYGESVGHYEGDTLVVDTIGIDAKNTWVDNFRTPHSDRLHVVERFRIVDGGKALHVDLHVEDDGAYTTPWNAVQRYDRADQEIVEYVCAENNVDIGDLDPMPEAKTPDF
jgi:hypothetical protein